MATYENNDYTSKGVGTAGLTLGVIGTALASGVLNGNGLGGLFGNQNPTANSVYQLAQKDNEIAQLKSEKYADAKVAALTERVANLEARVLADEKTDPLRDQILGDCFLGFAALGALKSNPAALVSKVKPWMEMSGILDAGGMVNFDSVKAALDMAFANVPKVSYFGFSFTSEDVPVLLAKMQSTQTEVA